MRGPTTHGGLVTPDELKDRLQKLDLADGVGDGKLASVAPSPAPAVPVVRRRRFRPRD